MRTTISIPDEIYSEARRVMGSRPFSEFASEAIQSLVHQRKREQLAREMAAGYQAEAVAPSLDPEWPAVETEGL